MVKYSRLPKKKENEKVECRGNDVTSCKRLCGHGMVLQWRKDVETWI